MNPSDFFAVPALDFERWSELTRADWGAYAPEEPNHFAGIVRTQNLYGFKTSEFGNSFGDSRGICWRTRRDVRLDGIDHFYVVFQLAGSSAIIQNDEVIKLGVGAAALVDSAQPSTHIHEKGSWHWLGLQLPREALISYLGFEPRSGLLERRFSRLLFQMFVDPAADEEAMTARARDYVQLAVYDLVGALVAQSEEAAGSPYADKMFERISAIIQASFTDAELEPRGIANQAGISLRTLQRLFRSKRTTCSRYLQSVRLDHARRLLRRRASLKTGQPLAQIAYASGYDDYNHFLRQFCRKFGQPPSRFG